MANISREHLIDGFVSEVDGYIPLIRSDLERLKENPEDPVRLEEIHRLFHNIKGAASQLALRYVSDTARIAEESLEHLIVKKVNPEPKLLHFLDRTASRIHWVCLEDVRDDKKGENLLKEIIGAYRGLNGAVPVDEVSLGRDFELMCEGKSIVDKSTLVDAMQQMQTALSIVERIKKNVVNRNGSAALPEYFSELREAVAEVGMYAETNGDSQPAAFIDSFHSFVDWLDGDLSAVDEQMVSLVGDYLGFLEILLNNPGKVEDSKVAHVVASMNQVRELSTMLVRDEDQQEFADLFENPEFLGEDLAEEPFPESVTDDLMDELFVEPASLEQEAESGEGSLDTDDVFEPAGFDPGEDLVPDTDFAKEIEGDTFRLAEDPDPAVLDLEDDLLAEFEPEDTVRAARDSGLSTEEPVAEDVYGNEDDMDLHEIFMAECEEHLQVIGKALIRLEQLVDRPMPVTGPVAENIAAMRRAIHTLKGAAGMTGFMGLSGFAHAGEDLLDAIVEAGAEVHPEDINLLARAVDLIEEMALSPEDSRQGRVEALKTEIGKALENREGIPDETPREGPDADEQAEASVGDDEDDMDLHEIFVAECEGHLQTISKALISLEQLVDQPKPVRDAIAESLAEMRRAVHTLKGAAGMTGFMELSGFAHTCEDLLDAVVESDSEVTPDDISLLAKAIDLIEVMSLEPDRVDNKQVEDLQSAVGDALVNRSDRQGGKDISPAEPIEGLAEDADAAIGDDPVIADVEIMPEYVPEAERSAGRRAEDRALLSDSANIRVRMEDLDELVSIESEIIVARSALEQRLADLVRTVEELDLTKEKLRKIAQELESGFEVESLFGFGQMAVGADVAMKPGQTVSEFAEFDPIELDRYSQLNLIIRSLNELTVDVGSIHAGISGLSNDLRGHVANQQLLMSVLQDKMLRVRMTPMSALTRSFFRTVRGAAGRLNKKVRLSVTGDDVYLDRYVWNKVADPIMHILRNGVDHGIESEDERRKVGKPVQASILMKALQRGSHVVLEITDDGRGIDHEAIKARVRQKGLAPDPEVLSKEQLLEYLFVPGFTTRDQVSQLSGRGVGLDVVKENLRELKGVVRVDSTPGQGTKFTLRIPVTLSINRAAIITLGEERYAVPLQDILEIRKIPADQITGGEEPTVLIGEETLPFKDLSVMTGAASRSTKRQKDDTDAIVLVVQGERQNVAMRIGGITEQQEIVVKDLGSHLKRVEGISGTTIMGDGSLIPILNLLEFAEMGELNVKKVAADITASQATSFKILIVDDSVSVRQSVSRLIKRKGWVPALATDGVDATEKLEGVRPDAIILDIEMPRMNGFEFMGVLRSNERYKDTPVIMLTSRFSEKHQEKAKELGVDHYVIKPYQEDQFVALLQNVATEARK